jgi:hypothetical protein
MVVTTISDGDHPADPGRKLAIRVIDRCMGDASGFSDRNLQDVHGVDAALELKQLKCLPARPAALYSLFDTGTDLQESSVAMRGVKVMHATAHEMPQQLAAGQRACSWTKRSTGRWYDMKGVAMRHDETRCRGTHRNGTKPTEVTSSKTA